MQTSSGSHTIPEAETQIPPTGHKQIDAAVSELRKDEWSKLSTQARIAILEAMLESTLASAREWVRESCRAKRLNPQGEAAGEEWLVGPVLVVRNIRLLIDSLQDIRAHGRPLLPSPPRQRGDGQVVAEVFPTDSYDAILFRGFRGEIWMQEEVELDRIGQFQAEFYRTSEKEREGKIALVLGAGNQSSIGPMDALYKLFAEGQVVILKMNPVNAYLGSVIEKAFAPLVERGFLRVVYGGAEVGDYLCNHPSVDEIHVTGSDKTHDAIVWGTGKQGKENKASGNRKNERPITSELGNVSPIIVVPGPWSANEISYQGMNIASSLANNAGFNCNATRVIVQKDNWNRREDLQDSIQSAFRSIPPRTAYYPGARDRYDGFIAEHPKAIRIGNVTEEQLPWTFIKNLDADADNDICFTTEAFCSVTSEVGIKAADTVEYIQKAVDFCNEKVWGSLNCSIIVHPDSMKDPLVKAAVEKAIANLRYGSVVINHWAALSYGFVSTTWGAFPGHPLENIESGQGVVHNTYLFDRPQKSVIYGPFKVWPKPAWFANGKTTEKIAKALMDFYASPSPAKLPKLLWAAVRN